MRHFNGTFLNTVFVDFLTELEKLSTYCDLKTLNFSQGQLPNYQIRAVRLLYLLRYFPAYATEYYAIFAELLAKRIQPPYNVLSVGCGSGIDYFSLYHYLADHGLSPDTYLRYHGVDVIQWDYQQTINTPNAIFSTLQSLSSLGTISEFTNVITFPKSLREINDTEVKYLCSTLATSTIRSERFALINAITGAGNEEGKCRQVADTLVTYHGFSISENQPYTFTEKVGFRKILRNVFEHYDHIIDYVKALHENCPTRRANQTNCDEACACMSRSPMMKTDHAKFEITLLTR